MRVQGDWSVKCQFPLGAPCVAQAALVTSKVEPRLKLRFPGPHKLLIAGPEEERSPHKLGQDWPWVPTSLQWWLLAGCVLCELFFLYRVTF